MPRPICQLILGFLLCTTAVGHAAAQVIFTVTNTADFGPGSLYQALEQADAFPGLNLIHFNIPGPGPHEIVMPPLVNIFSPVIMDGFTQPGATPNTNGLGEPSNADLRIIIVSETVIYHGADGTTLRGLVFQSSDATQCCLIQSYASDVTVTGCYVGTDATGLLPSPLTAEFGLVSLGTNIQVGGPDPADLCVISGNSVNGILFDSSNSHEDVGSVEGCYIGVDATGTGAMGNGPGPLLGNGIRSNNTGALITLNISRSIIANNGGTGILIPGNILATMNQNSIYDNGLLGIDILGAGVTEHAFAPFVVITDADADTGIIEGTFAAFGSGLDHEIEFFSSPTCDPSGYGEGKTYLGTYAFTSASGLPTPFMANLGPLPPLEFVTAVTIVDGVIASEFSLCHEVIQAAAPIVTNAAATGPGSLAQALLDADSDPDLTTIEFDLPGPGPHVIAAPAGGLSINSAVVIDGFSQPGSSPNGEASGKASNAVLKIVIDTPGGPIKINPGGAGTVLQGLVINSDVTAAIDSDADNVTVRGCYLGTDASGMNASGGTPQRGILSTGLSLVVGGASPADLCLISANSFAGVEITAGTALIRGCYIGTDATGTGALGNGPGGGVVSSVTLGTIVTVSNCVVAHNAGAGLRGIGTAPIRARANSIFANGGLGIDTGTAGPSPDPAAPAPVITSVDPVTGEINGTIESPGSEAKFEIEFFANTSCDASGFGEGEFFLGNLQFNAGAAGTVPFTAMLGALAQSNGVVATATNASDMTSEFSACSETATAVGPPPGVPSRLNLAQNRPNPFNPATMIDFSVPAEGRVRLEIFDVSGRRVRVLLDEMREAGPGSVRWDGTSAGGASVASGVYFYRVSVGGERVTKRMVLVR